MKSEHLVRMANQIGEFFDAMPDQDEARAGVIDHIRKFWDPRMRSALLAHLDTNDGEGLSAFVRAALDGGRAGLER